METSGVGNPPITVHITVAFSDTYKSDVTLNINVTLNAAKTINERVKIETDILCYCKIKSDMQILSLVLEIMHHL